MDGDNMNNSIPEEFMKRMKTQLDASFSAFEAEYEKAAVRGLRVNPLKPSGLLQEKTRALEPIPWEPNGYYLDEDDEAGKTVLHEAGAFYLQEPSAMIPAAILSARPGERILDLCASPGGKSTQIGAALQGEGLVVCNEIVPKRAQILSRNIERMGIRNAVVTCETPERLADRFEGCFDAVLADAPCSGEGMFRRDPETAGEWSPEKAEGCAARQAEILRQAARMIRPGGRLVYSTCTFHPAENEENVEKFLRGNPDFEAEAFSIAGMRERRGYRTFYPHEIRGEGQFAALLRKKEGREGKPFPKKTLPSLSREERQILETLYPEEDFREAGKWGSLIILQKEEPDLDGLRVLRNGLHLADLRERHPVPDHAAAMSGPMIRAANTDLTYEQAAAFLRGETVEGDGKGWMLVRYGGLAIGWGKAGQGMIKNHYPKGLRRNYLLA